MRRWLAAVVGACSSSQPAPAQPAPAQPTHAPFTIPPSGPFALPADWVACRVDSDCTIVALGCCENTAVAVPHAADAQSALELSGRRECPVKDACGPSANGTWEGVMGKCVDTTCRLPPQ